MAGILGSGNLNQFLLFLVFKILVLGGKHCGHVDEFLPFYMLTSSRTVLANFYLL